ncbi:MAG: 3-deoxy-D-manno-octulosonic acid transferase [Thermoanaerobaculia bacterium]|nr:3-deoxy-D-manno-octulosonic acid transferase [Thermoanaerobaculia bacterium]
MFVLYEVILCLVFVLLLPGFLVLRLIRGKQTGSISERIGFKLGDGSHELWIHAVSVGEVSAAGVIIARLSEIRPDTTVLVTTTTVTGQNLARRIFQDATVTWFPFDFSFSVARFIDAYRPGAYVAIETELWPNVARILSARGIPAVIVNGRISDRSFPRYRLIRPLAAQILRRYRAILVREDVDRERFIAMGAERDRVEVVGNVKFDYQPSSAPLEFVDSLEKVSTGRHLFVAGSTVAREEEQILEILPQLTESVLTILAPRKPGRFDEVASLLERNGVRYVRRSEIERSDGADVILLDTIGELSRLYAHARVAFVGGSLVPSGGHNPIEPAAVGVPVAFGPHMNNFRDISAALVRSGGGTTVRSPGELKNFVIEMISDEAAHQERSRAALETVERNRGAVERIAARLAEILG